MILTKCCCCFNLRYGYFAYGILSMAARLIACISLYHASIIFAAPSVNLDQAHHRIAVSQGVSIYAGWVITSAVCLFFTLKGIVQKRSILIFPYLVILVVEIIGLIVSGILSAIFVTIYYLVILPIAGPILVYEFCCLYSLHKLMRSNEKMQHIVEEMTPLDTVC